MIKAITVQNFQRIDNATELKLGRVNVIVGENGSGKSSFLKAIHWSTRCATLAQYGKVTLEQMDFVPSKDFLELSHKLKLQNNNNGRKITVKFTDENDSETSIEISASRNDAGVNVNISGPLMEKLVADTRPSTAYIPGLSGMAEEETILAIPVMHRKAASGEGGSVLRQIILALADDNAVRTNEYVYLDSLSKWVGKILPGVKFWVKFDRLRDRNISVKFLTPEMRVHGQREKVSWKSIDMAGTGFLQVVQIFAYLLYFKPTLLLIDEPDAHLHPGRQQLLIKAIEVAIKEFPDTQIILTTHAPSLVKALSDESTIHWMADGIVKAHGTTVKERMGWSALDKDLILFTEDGNTAYIQAIVDQWPDLSNRILIWPVFGKGSLPFGSKARNISEKLGIKTFVYFDRDFMSDADVSDWRSYKEYSTNNISSWCPEDCDIESAFCQAQYIASVLGVELEIADNIISAAVASFEANDISTHFTNSYSSAITNLASRPGRDAIVRWNETAEINRIKGKFLLEAIKKCAVDILKQNGLTQKIGNRNLIGTIPDGSATICSELGSEIRAVLNAQY